MTLENVRVNLATLVSLSSFTELRLVSASYQYQFHFVHLQVIGIFAGFAVLLLVASPLLLIAAPCLICCKCRYVKTYNISFLIQFIFKDLCQD